MPRLAIVIVSYNGWNDLNGCLRSLADAAPPIDHQVVVVDNASTDGTPARVREQWPQVHLIDSASNRGFAAANNVGIRATESELVLLLNPDTLVPRGAIAALVAALDADPRTAIVGPRIVDGKGRAELSFGRMISPLAELRQKVLVAGNDRGVSWIAKRVERMTRRSRDVDWVSGACLLARRAAIESAGLLDERFFLYTEDVDLCASVRANGGRVRFDARIEIVHVRGRSAASAPAAARAAYRRSQIAFYDKHHPAWAPVLRAYLRFRGQHPEP